VPVERDLRERLLPLVAANPLIERALVIVDGFRLTKRGAL
jgi:hypothetical protein